MLAQVSEQACAAVLRVPRPQVPVHGDGVHAGRRLGAPAERPALRRGDGQVLPRRVRVRHRRAPTALYRISQFLYRARLLLC